MNDTNTGGPAFPQVSTDQNGDLYQPGLSMRDYFAAKAMQGIIASRGKNQLVYGDIASNISFMSFCFADAMLKEREA